MKKTIGLFLMISSFFFLSGINYSQLPVSFVIKVCEIAEKEAYTPLKKILPKRNKEFIQTKYNFVKRVPSTYEELFDSVCVGFPELINEDIVLVMKKIKTTMQARPYNVFGKIKYKIYLNSDKNFKGIHFQDIPQKAKIGIIAHEMCHILDYKHKSKIELLKTGIRFLSKEGRAKYEKSIDILTIKKGFGSHLKAWAHFAMYDSNASDKYKAFKKYYYLKPKEIEWVHFIFSRCGLILL